MDIALVLSPGGSSADLAIIKGDIATDATLQTAILASLQSDRLADPGDIIPDGGTNRRGWWADAYLPALPDGSPDFWGSKLWLRRRVTATLANAALMQGDIEQALAWMKLDGLASEIIVTTAWASAIALNIGIVIVRSTPGGVINSKYDLVWNASLGTVTLAGAIPVAAATTLDPYGLVDAQGNQLLDAQGNPLEYAH